MAISVPIITTFDSKGIQRAIRDFKKLDGAAAKTGYAMQTLDAGAKKLAGGIAKVGAIGGVIGGVVGKTLIDAAVESRKALAQTEAIIRTTGGAAGVTSKQVQQLSDTLSKQIGVDDELIQQSANLLLTFKQVQNQIGSGNDIFNQAVTLAQDLGNVFGNADSAAIQLGKALSDPVKGITALRRAGINFTDAQKQQIKSLVDSGKALEAQKLILKEVKSQVGGTAAATATAMDKMKVATDNLAEQFGNMLLPAVEAFANFVSNKVVPTMRDFGNVVAQQGVGAGLEFLSGKVINAISGMNTFGKIVVGLASAFAALRVATMTYTATMSALNIVMTLSNGAVKALVVSLGQAKIAMLAAGTVTAVLAGAALLYAKYASEKAKATQRTLDMVNALTLEGEAQSGALKELVKNNPQFKVMIAGLSDIGLKLSDVTEYANTGKGAFAKYVEGLKILDSNTGTTVQGLDAYARAVGIAAGSTTSAGGEISFALSQMAYLARGLRGDAESTAAALKLLGGVGVTTGKGLGTFSGSVTTAKDRLKAFVGALRSYRSDSKAYTQSIQDQKQAHADLKKATLDLLAAQTEFNNVVKGYGANSKQAATAGEALDIANRAQARAGFDVEAAQQAVIAATNELNRVRGTQGADAQTIRDAEIALATAQFDLADAQLAQRDAATEAANAQTHLNETINGAPKGSDTYKAAQDKLTAAQKAYKDAQTAVTDAIDAQAAAYDRLKDSLDAVFASQKKVNAQQQAEAEKRTGVTIKGRRVIVRSLTPADLEGKADGGAVSANTPYIVGERGQELFVPNTNGTIIPNNALTGVSRGDTYNITINSKIADDTLPDLLVRELRKYNRRSGAINIQVV